MVHHVITIFLLRWLYLNNLIRDRAEIQTLPHLSYPHSHHRLIQQAPPHEAPPTSTATVAGGSAASGQQGHHEGWQQPRHHPQYQAHGGPQRHQFAPQQPPHPEQLHSQHPSQQQQPRTQAQTTTLHETESQYRARALRYVALYPPGITRLYALDSLRLELVQSLKRELERADEIVGRVGSASSGGIMRGGGGLKKRAGWGLDSILAGANDGSKEDDDRDEREGEEDVFNREGEDPYLDADPDINDDLNAAIFGAAEIDANADADEKMEGEDADDDADGIGSEDAADTLESSSIGAARALHLESREYLPQLVSAVLHSPPALSSSTQRSPHGSGGNGINSSFDPLRSLRRLLVSRCRTDPNLGVELCWLLEAEVGRAWKQLFEHRQRTGRRLIVMLPAEKAVVLAKIGVEKRAAFDLLQDVEQATAYGTSVTRLEEEEEEVEEFESPRLPAALSQRRCSHFGDTMHLIDRLTQISLDLQCVPTLQRTAYLRENLCELNRRLRRRMFTRGELSLDVEDNHGPYDWPTVEDITLDMLKFSVHFPLEPKSIIWPGPDDYVAHRHDADSTLFSGSSKHGVMRVLNIVSGDARLLASRERCPFLVHLEVAETGLEGNDARLYASGVQGLGLTLEEAMGMLQAGDGAGMGRTSAAAAAAAASHRQQRRREVLGPGFPSYQIPSELGSPIKNTLPPQEEEEDVEVGREAAKTEKEFRDPATTDEVCDSGDDDDSADDEGTAATPNAGDDEINLPTRGGWQEDDGSYFYPPPPGGDYFGIPSPYDMVRQEEIEELHMSMQSSRNNEGQSLFAAQPQPSQYSIPSGPMVSTGKALLDKVYGLPWVVRCDQIRHTSSYGKIKGWRLASFILKAGEDIRREALVMQVISKLKGWFDSEIPEANRPYLRPYTIMCVGGDAGILECVHDAKSVDEVKKETDRYTSLRDYFERAYGPPKPIMRPAPAVAPPLPPSADAGSGEITFEKAQDNFLRSLVGYSLVCYILEIKDRHNANILMGREGHLIHIDFGFVLGDTPKMAKVPIFNERAPFKLTKEFWDVLGGWNFNEGGLGVRFCKMFEEAFACASSHADEIATLIEAAILNLTSDAKHALSLSNRVRSRLKMTGDRGSAAQKMFIMDLVDAALTDWGTTTYDWLQKSMNGYQ